MKSKMRLIDADRMKRSIVDNGCHEIAAELRRWVDNQIAVDAIPVEWLRSQMHDDPNDIESAYDDICIGELIQKWHKEHEART